MLQPNSPDRFHELSAELVMYAGRLVRAVSRRTTPDVPAATLRLLSQVEELAPVSISQLATADRCSQPTMSNAVAHLTEKGWAVKKPHPTDARSTLVELTAAGREALTDARQRNGDVVAERILADARHGVDDLAAAVALLHHLLESDPDESGDPS